MEMFVFPQELKCLAVLLMICAGHESKHINHLSNFCQDQSFVSQNNRYLAYCTKDVPRGMQTKFPSIIMKFWLISSKGQVMPPPTSFPKGWGWTQRSTWMSWRRWWSPGPRKPSERGHLSCSRIVHPALHPEIESIWEGHKQNCLQDQRGAEHLDQDFVCPTIQGSCLRELFLVQRPYWDHYRGKKRFHWLG